METKIFPSIIRIKILNCFYFLLFELLYYFFDTLSDQQKLSYANLIFYSKFTNSQFFIGKNLDALKSPEKKGSRAIRIINFSWFFCFFKIYFTKSLKKLANLGLEVRNSITNGKIEVAKINSSLV